MNWKKIGPYGWEMDDGNWFADKCDNGYLASGFGNDGKLVKAKQSFPNLACAKAWCKEQASKPPTIAPNGVAPLSHTIRHEPHKRQTQ